MAGGVKRESSLKRLLLVHLCIYKLLLNGPMNIPEFNSQLLETEENASDLITFKGVNIYTL